MEKDRGKQGCVVVCFCALRVLVHKRWGAIGQVGLDAAGKTTILYRLKLGEIVTTIPTIGELLVHAFMVFIFPLVWYIIHVLFGEAVLGRTCNSFSNDQTLQGFSRRTWFAFKSKGTLLSP